jgi:hypothetical protein
MANFAPAGMVLVLDNCKHVLDPSVERFTRRTTELRPLFVVDHPVHPRKGAPPKRFRVQDRKPWPPEARPIEDRRGETLPSVGALFRCGGVAGITADLGGPMTGRHGPWRVDRGDAR